MQGWSVHGPLGLGECLASECACKHRFRTRSHASLLNALDDKDDDGDDDEDALDHALLRFESSLTLCELCRAAFGKTLFKHDNHG